MGKINIENYLVPKPGTREWRMTDDALVEALNTYHKFSSHASHIRYLRSKYGYSKATWEKYVGLIAKKKGRRKPNEKLDPAKRIDNLMKKLSGTIV